MKFGPGEGRRSDPYGATRTSVRARHALLTPDGVVPGALPGWHGANCFTVISPAMGARFSQYHIELPADAAGTGETRERQWMMYLLAGSVRVVIGSAFTDLHAGGFAYLPPGTSYAIKAKPGAAASLLIFEKTYRPPPDGGHAPAALFGHEGERAGTPFLGDPAAMLQVLLPEVPAFDMAVNIFKYAPGATLPFVETHVMEHGLLMLAGEGIYRLEDQWYPVRAGDAIWMAAYCPQWFVATGKTPASYIYYKDVNRWPA